MTSNPSPRAAPPWQPRFTILGMMLATLVVAMGAAGVSYLVRFGGQGRFGHLIFIIITLAGPLILVIAVSLVLAATSAWNRPRKTKLRP